MEEEEKKKNIFTTESIDNRDYRDLFGEIGNCGMREWVKGEDGTNVPDFKHPLYPPPYLRLDFRHLFKFLRVKAGTRSSKLQLAIDNSSIEWETFRQGRNRNVSNEVVITGVCTAAEFLKTPLISLLAQFLKECETKKIRLSSHAEYAEIIKSFLQHAPDLVEQPQATFPPLFSQDNQEHASRQTVAKNWAGYKPVTGEDKWLDPNNYEALPLKGRKAEFELLDEFIKADGQFKIWAVAGPSGSGKTRLVSEWSTTSPKLIGWRCRVLHKEDRAEPNPGKWVRGSSADSILIIIDYMYGFEKVIQKLMKNRFEATSPKIRLLVIDHIFSENLYHDERWGLTGNQSSRNQNEDYFFLIKPLDLRQTQEEIIKSIIARRANIDEKSDEVGNANEYLLTLKEQGAYHPLFAALVGDAIRSGKDFTVGNRRELIDYYLSGNDRLPWEHGTKTGRWASHFVAVATARRKMTYDDLFKVGSKFKAAPKDFKKVKKICQKVISDNKESILSPFEPDILGESFFLKFLQSLKTSPEYQEEFRQVFMSGNEETQAKDAIEFIAFILRLTRNLLNDNQNDKETQALWDTLFNFMTPSNFKGAELIKWAVTAGLIDIVEAVKDRFPEEEICALIKKIEPDVFYWIRNEDLLGAAVLYSMRHFELIQKFTKIVPQLPTEMTALLKRYSGPDTEGMPLIIAIYCKFTKVINALIASKVDVNATFIGGRNALMIAIDEGYTEAVKSLLDANADVHGFDNERKTALIYATTVGDKEVVKLLLDRQLNVGVADLKGRTALIYSCMGGHKEVVKLLVDREVNVDASDSMGRTGLTHVCRTGLIHSSTGDCKKIIELLLEKGAKIDVIDSLGCTPLIYACEQDNVDVVKLLLDEDAKIDLTSRENRTALIYAGMLGHKKTVKLLLQKEAKPDIADILGRTALIHASASGHIDTVKLLLEKGADIHATDNNNYTALTHATTGNHIDIVKLLLKNGAHPDVLDENGRTALMLLSYKGHVKAVKLLLEKGANISAVDKVSRTPLMYATAGGNIMIIRLLLLNTKVDIDAIDIEARTALFWACLYNHTKGVQLLLTRKARVDLADNNGQTVLSIAKAKGHEEIVQLLVKHGSKNQPCDESE